MATADERVGFLTQLDTALDAYGVASLIFYLGLDVDNHWPRGEGKRDCLRLLVVHQGRRGSFDELRAAAEDDAAPSVHHFEQAPRLDHLRRQLPPDPS